MIFRLAATPRGAFGLEAIADVFVDDQHVGLGRRLVGEGIAFARAKGYRKLVLWTQSNLAAARAIYRKAGFRLVKAEPHAGFGVPLVGEYWALRL